MRDRENETERIRQRERVRKELKRYNLEQLHGEGKMQKEVNEMTSFSEIK